MADFDIAGVQNMLSMMSPQDKTQLSMVGQQALASGQVKPEAAAAIAAHPAFQSAMAGVPASSTPRKQIKAENKNVDTSKDTTTATHFSAPDEYLQRMKAISEAPWIKDEQDSIQKSQDRLNMQQGQVPQNDGSAWIRPLAAYVDSTQGTKLSAAANALPSNAERLASIASTQDALSKRKNELAKTIFEGGKQLKDGTTVNLVGNTGTQGGMTTTGDFMGAGGLASTRAASLAAHATGQYDVDKMLVPLANSFNNFDKFQGMMDDKKTPVTRAIFNNMQEELTRAAKAGGGAGGTADANIVRDQMDTFTGELNAFETKFGKITDMRAQAPQLFAQLQSYKNQLRADFEGAYKQRVGELKNNFDVAANMLGRPDIAQASHDKADDLIKARVTGGKSLAQAAAASGPIKVTNPKTGESHIIAPGPKQQQDLADAAAEGFKAAQ